MIPPSPPSNIPCRRPLRCRVASRRRLFFEEEEHHQPQLPDYWQPNFADALPTPPPKKKMWILNFSEF